MSLRTNRSLLSEEQGVQTAYAAHGAELFRAALRLTRDRHHAEEVVQETFLRAWKAADRFDETIGSLRTWLFGILRNVAIDRARAESVRPLAPQRVVSDAADASSPADEIESALLAWQLEEGMGRLSADHRRVLIEVHLRGRSIAEVAGELRIPEGTVKSRVYYALRALRIALEELGWMEVDG